MIANNWSKKSLSSSTHQRFVKAEARGYSSSLKEECGLVGVCGFKKAAQKIYLGLHSLQHRGQESAGIAVTDHNALQKDKPQNHSNNYTFNSHVNNDNSNRDLSLNTHKGINLYKSFGRVSEIFNSHNLEKLTGNMGIGHVRYATSESGNVENIQPFYFNLIDHGALCLAHNGNITNANVLRSALQSQGSVFSTTSDSEVVIHLLAKSTKSSLEEKIKEAASVLKGGFAILILSNHCIYGLRDRFGLRPMVIGKNENSFVLASESCAFDLLEVNYQSEIKPGHLIKITHDCKTETKRILNHTNRAFCSFEPIYFSRVDSRCGEFSIYEIRKRIGQVLAELYPVKADCVLAVPDSSMAIAIGYSQAANIPLELGMVRNHYVGRTFIEPSQKARDTGVMLKLNANRSVIEKKDCIVIDDSIVRGTTSLKIIKMLKKMGANKIHFRVGSPPVTHSCYYGISTPNRSQLIAARQNVEQIRIRLGVDSLGYLTKKGLSKALKSKQFSNVKNDQSNQFDDNSYCMACFAGTYPEKIDNPLAYESHPTDKMGCGYYSEDKEQKNNDKLS